MTLTRPLKPRPRTMTTKTKIHYGFRNHVWCHTGNDKAHVEKLSKVSNKVDFLLLPTNQQCQRCRKNISPLSENQRAELNTRLQERKKEGAR